MGAGEGLRDIGLRRRRGWVGERRGAGGGVLRQGVVWRFGD